MGRKLIDITGKKFNHLEVIKLDHEKNGVRYWLCKCDCGNNKVINGDKIKRGEVKACGCLRGKKTKYNYQNKKLYKKWQHMMSRCYNENDISYKNYGGRGIKVCNKWKNYDEFAKWSLTHGYSENLEIDRINVNGSYSPRNCRYITNLENKRNRRITLKYNYNGQLLTLKEIADINNIQYKTLWSRMKKNNQNLKKCLY